MSKSCLMLTQAGSLTHEAESSETGEEDSQDEQVGGGGRGAG